jgi:hypothetical protein
MIALPDQNSTAAAAINRNAAWLVIRVLCGRQRGGER